MGPRRGTAQSPNQKVKIPSREKVLWLKNRGGEKLS